MLLGSRKIPADTTRGNVNKKLGKAIEIVGVGRHKQ